MQNEGCSCGNDCWEVATYQTWRRWPASSASDSATISPAGSALKVMRSVMYQNDGTLPQMSLAQDWSLRWTARYWASPTGGALI